MIDFNFEPTDYFTVRTTDDGTEIRFDEHTLGVVPTSTGYSITNDWNNRHFTIGFTDKLVLYHLTREDISDRGSGKRAMSRAEFIAELYAWVRAFAYEVKEDDLSLDFVGILDLDSVRDSFIDEGIAIEADGGLDIDMAKEKDLVTKIVNQPQLHDDLLGDVFTPLDVSEMRDSGETIFFYPTKEDVKILFLYPIDRVGIASGRDLMNGSFIGGWFTDGRSRTSVDLN